jgi:hypothetical protein
MPTHKPKLECEVLGAASAQEYWSLPHRQKITAWHQNHAGYVFASYAKGHGYLILPELRDIVPGKYSFRGGLHGESSSLELDYCFIRFNAAVLH